MNKYQKHVFDKLGKGNSVVFSCCCPIEDKGVKKTASYGAFNGDNDTFTIQQDEDIKKTQYALIVDTGKVNPFEQVLTHKNGEWFEVPCIDGQYKFIADFNDRINEVRFVFKHDIAEDYVVKLVYVEADKDKYYAKIEQARRAELLKAADIRVATGADLVNIYFQPCANTYYSAKIELYTAEGRFEDLSAPKVMVYGEYIAPSKLLGGTVKTMIGKFNVEQDMFYKSITGLAHGVYAIKLIQLDKNGKELLKSDELFFVIR